MTKRRETYRRKPTLWDIIPGWAYATLFITMFAFALYGAQFV